MSRTIIGCNLAVIGRMLIFVPYHHRDWGSCGFAFKDAGYDPGGITFISLCGKFGLTGLASV